MISPTQTGRLSTFCAMLIAIAACGGEPAALDQESAIIDPPAQCSPDRPDCYVSQDFPESGELDATNSAGLRFSDDTGSLVVDRVSSLPDIDGDGVPDDADDCPGTPDWISCDNDPTNDGIYATVFYDPSGAAEVTRTETALTTADIPRIDVYFLIDATPTLAEEITVLQTEILNTIDDIRLDFPDAQFGLGLYREYPLDPLAAPYSQAPYHHILDLTDDEILVQVAVSTLNTVANATSASAATQAMYSIASGLGLGDMVPNRGSCPNAPDADVGYPCFRADALHVVMNITDAEVHNGPDEFGPQYVDPPFGPGVGLGVMDLPPVEMFPALFGADSGSMPLDLGDLSGRSLTLMGMSTLLTDEVDTDLAPGCIPTPPVPPDVGLATNAKDAVIALRFDSLVTGVSAFANNTHWPGANLALFDDVLLDPTMALACDGGAGVQRWGSVSWVPTTSQQYYLVADGIVPAADPMHEPEGAFSVSIVHDGDPPNPAWLTSDAPVGWTDVETALLASDLRVASVVTLRDAMDVTSPGNADARLLAEATDARTKLNGQWVTELPSASGEGLGPAISNTIGLAATDSVYDFSLVAIDNDATPIDEREFIVQIRHEDCAEGQPLACARGFGDSCLRCDLGATLAREVLFRNNTVAPMAVSQVLDFELVSWADDAVEAERVPVRVMVPDAAAHAFDGTFEANFYRNFYDSTDPNGNGDTTDDGCSTPPERPKWGDLTWDGSTPAGTSIEFQIRTANTEADLLLAVPAVVTIPTDTTEPTFNLADELLADGQPNGLPYIQITALLNPSNSPPATPTLRGWSFEFVCEAAE